jgi:hypothetical protein
MIKVLRTDSVEFKEVRRCAVLLNPLDQTNETRRVVMVSLTIDKPAHDRAISIAEVKGTLNEQERNEVRAWGEHVVHGPCKVVMSV